jgi:hypothetical protein
LLLFLFFSESQGWRFNVYGLLKWGSVSVGDTGRLISTETRPSFGEGGDFRAAKNLSNARSALNAEAVPWKSGASAPRKLPNSRRA